MRTHLECVGLNVLCVAVLSFQYVCTCGFISIYMICSGGAYQNAKGDWSFARCRVQVGDLATRGQEFIGTYTHKMSKSTIINEYKIACMHEAVHAGKEGGSKHVVWVPGSIWIDLG